MTKTKMVHKTPHDASNKSLEAYRSTGVPTDFAALVTKAEAGWSAFKAAETVRFFQAAAQVHEVLALIYAVHEVGKDAPHEYAEFLKARQVEPSPRAHNDYYATVQAFVDVKERSTLRQRVSQYAQVLVIMAERKIAPGSAASWLSQAETVSGKKLSGIAKALSLYRSLPSVKARNSAATVEADEKAKRSVAAFIENIEATPIASLSGAEALVALAGRPLILLARSDVKGNVKLLRVIANDNDAVAALVKPFLKKLGAAEA